MYKATKDGRVQMLTSDTQAVAFRRAGWEIDGEEAPQRPAEDDVELDALKAEAEALGVEYHPNIGYEKLKARVDEARGVSE